MSAHILIVEDEAAITALIRFTLENAGYTVSSAANITEAQQHLQHALPDALLLDWMLPGTSGAEYTRQLRAQERTRELPIILLTARGTESDKEQGLNWGADDYITKPFSPRELIARINALLRRRAPQKTRQPVSHSGLNLEPDEQRASIGGIELNLGPSEYKLLHFLITHPERTYSRSQLLDHIWGDHIYLEERTIDVHIRRLRLALEPGGCDGWIQTVRGIGYCFVPPKNTENRKK